MVSIEMRKKYDYNSYGSQEAHTEKVGKSLSILRSTLQILCKNAFGPGIAQIASLSAGSL